MAGWRIYKVQMDHKGDKILLYRKHRMDKTVLSGEAAKEIQHSLNLQPGSKSYHNIRIRGDKIDIGVRAPEQRW